MRKTFLFAEYAAFKFIAYAPAPWKNAAAVPAQMCRERQIYLIRGYCFPVSRHGGPKHILTRAYAFTYKYETLSVFYERS